MCLRVLPVKNINSGKPLTKSNITTAVVWKMFCPYFFVKCDQLFLVEPISQISSSILTLSNHQDSINWPSKGHYLDSVILQDYTRWWSSYYTGLGMRWESMKIFETLKIAILQRLLTLGYQVKSSRVQNFVCRILGKKYLQAWGSFVRFQRGLEMKIIFVVKLSWLGISQMIWCSYFSSLTEILNTEE